jgi:hypothetical protein
MGYNSDMKRQHKGQKSRSGNSNSQCGGEYWKSRPGGTTPGKDTKKLTHRIERRTAKRKMKQDD